MTVVTPPPPVQVFSISWKQIWAVIGAIVIISVVTILWTRVVFGGIKEDMKHTNARVIALESSYREAITSWLKVQDTHDTVIKIENKLEMLNQKVDANEERNRIHLDNIQKQVHSIPGVPK